MAKNKRKIRLIIWMSIIIYLIITMFYVGHKLGNATCKEIEVHVNDSTGHKFVQPIDVKNMLAKHQVIGKSLDSINIFKLETELKKNTAIKKVSIYKTLAGKLIVDLEQRNPILRIINTKGQNFYLDEDGILMAVHSGYAARVLVANGKIEASFVDGLNLLKYTDDVTSRKYFLVRDLFYLTKYINSQAFWKCQIEQVFVNVDLEFELIPLVGEHTILFGRFEDFEWKFKKLEAFYKQGLKQKGWSMYKQINVKFSNQVVCTRR